MDYFQGFKNGNEKYAELTPPGMRESRASIKLWALHVAQVRDCDNFTVYKNDQPFAIGSVHDDGMIRIDWVAE